MNGRLGGKSWVEAARPQQTANITGHEWQVEEVAGKAGRLATISVLEKVLKKYRGEGWRKPEVPEVSVQTHGL